MSNNEANRSSKLYYLRDTNGSPILDAKGNRIYRNLRGKSVGLFGDGIKLGGGRWNLDLGTTLQSQGESPLGGLQGGVGVIGWPNSGFGWAYQAGDLSDYIVEAFAGVHDVLNSPFSYNSLGNNYSMAMFPKVLSETMNIANVFIASPIVFASVMHPSLYVSFTNDDFGR